MRILRKSNSKSIVFRLVFLLIFLLFVTNFSLNNLFVASAFSSQINIYPDSFNTEFSEHKLAWQKPANILFQDLSFEDSFDKFNTTNSAFISTFQLIESDIDYSNNEDDGDIGEVLGIEEEFQEGEEPDNLNFTELVDNESGAFDSVIDNIEEKEGEIEEEIIEEIKELIIEEDEFNSVPKEEVSENEEEVSFIFDGFKSLLNSFNLNFAKADNEILESLDNDLIKNSLIISGFSLPVDYSKETINKISLKTSLAALSNIKGDKLIFEYSFNSMDWESISKIDINNKIANSDKENYYTYPLFIIDEIGNLSNLQIRISYESQKIEEINKREIGIFIDALWLELDYDEASEDVPGEIDMDLISVFEDSDIDREIKIIEDKKYFTKDNNPEFVFEYKKTRKSLFKKIGAGLAGIFLDEYRDIKIEVKLRNSQGSKIKIEPIVKYLDDGQFEIYIDENIRQFEPGKYAIEVFVSDGAYVSKYVQDFEWGVLALNINKSIFQSEEVAYFQMAVLDNEGHTLCDAGLLLEIETPDNETIRLSTNNGLIKRNSLCGPDNVIDEPDYYAYFGLKSLGRYNLKLSAETDNGFYEVVDFIEARKTLEFDIERIGPSRIYPLADYKMDIKVSPRNDFKGQFREFIPSSFKIKEINGAQIVQLENEKVIIWEVDWQIGGTYDMGYIFDAPDISPEFFLLGPAQVASEKGNTIFSEARKWQIASDAVVTYDYDGGTSVNWNNPSNAWDSVDNTYASRDIPRRSVDDSANYLEANANSVPSLGYTINSVEIGIEAYVEDTAVSAYLTPVFNGTSGTATTAAGTLLGTIDSGTTFYFDITNEGEAPGTWTWADIQTLDVQIYGNNTSNSQPRNLYIDQVKIRVDYTIPNDPPTGSFTLATQKTNGSGVFDIEIEIDDPDDDDTSAMIEYSLGNCPFGASLDPTLSEIDGDTTADFGDPHIINSNTYQIGNATGWIETASGTNSVFFDWDSKIDEANGDGDYCLRLTVDDGTTTSTADTQSVTIDNVDPDIPGSMTINSVAGTSVTFNFGLASDDTNFDKYIIFYKEGSSGATTTDSSFTNADMDLVDYNGASTVNIPSLFPSTQYVFNIWAYDDFGNLSLAVTEVTTTTLAQLVPPISSVNSVAQKTDASGVVDFSIEVNDGNDDDVRVRVDYEIGSTCTFASPLDPNLDETPVNISADFGTVIIDNSSIYQVGTSTGWIKTASGSNSILFDWDTKTDLPTADGVYCIQITANDNNADQNIPATSTLLIDNVAPSSPGALSLSTTTDTSITLNFGETTTDSNFNTYKIFYKIGSSDVGESDLEHSDADLSDISFNGTLTTKVSNLKPNATYVFNIYAYDDYGNKASSTEVNYTTEEARPRRVKTVTYLAGLNYGNGVAGENSDVSNTFSTFNFKLGEGDVEIRNAYIIFEAQFEAYANNVGNYSGYNLAFDTCVEPCTADALGATDKIIKDENTILSYDETESNQIRLLYDVTTETQLAAYSGSSVEMEAQIAYRLERGGASNSISYSSAQLVISYVYDDSLTTNTTNTIYYPLDSNVSGDSGTRLSSQVNGCTLNIDCPTFSYQMDIPEYGSSVSDWFRVQAVNDHNNSTKDDDFTLDINIETYDINSNSVIHEVANAGGQGKPLPYYFETIPGFSPNLSQSLEMHPSSVLAYTYYLLGGEVAMTYIASSSASTKTRTVSFPLGVINNGGTTALSNSSVGVYFPENGAS
ncbi:MAG: fibronectin type III domain-containing protein, partial [Bacteroidales bacterium]|nr:fibronectin type III domain-containing protein [Bacteroidales bacterium]